MNWKLTRDIAIAIFVISAAILLFGNMLGLTVTSTQILKTGFTYVQLIAVFQIYLAFIIYKEYIGNNQWFAFRPLLLVLSIISGFILFNWASSFGVVVSSARLAGIAVSTILGAGQAFFVWAMLTRHI